MRPATRIIRAFIADDLGATAHIKRNLTGRVDRPLDRTLQKERHLVECFFNQIKRFRRILRRCEATISSLKAFVDLACTMERISQMQTPPEALKSLMSGSIRWFEAFSERLNM